MADSGKSTAGSADLDPACELQDDLSDPRYRQLPLRECRNAGLTKSFHDCDQSAITNRDRHRRITLVAVICGTLAIATAIGELGVRAAAGLGWKPESWVETSLFFTESVLVGLAIAAVIVGTCFHLKRKWLADRHRASLCARLKFEFLMQPRRWLSSGAAEQYLESELSSILKPPYKQLLATVVDGPLPHAGIEVDDNLLLPRETLRQLIEYYLDRRLRPQKEYLVGGVKRNKTIGHILHELPHGIFVASALAVLLHVVLRCRKPYAATLAVLAAAVLPVFSILARALGAAFEYSRNSSRFQAAQAALMDKEDLLLHELLPQYLGRFGSDEQPVRAAPVLRQLWWCEHVLTGEHIEWLSLMYRTEWYV